MRYWPIPVVTPSAMSEQQHPNSPDHFPAERSEFFLPGPAGSLECIADVPEPECAVPAVAVICHPHPVHGGTMHNKVVTIVERSLREVGLRTVRFNFRGAGASEGDYDEGYGETDDLLAVVEWVRKVCPEQHLWLAGFSFGGYVAARAARGLDVRQLISIAPPVDRYEFQCVEHPGCPWLVIQGDEDDVVSAEAVQQWAQDLTPQPDLVMMEHAGHFFHRRLMDLRGLIKNGVREQLPARQ